MFREVTSPGKPPGRDAVTVVFEGKRIAAHAGETVAATLLRAGEVHFRDADSQDHRGPYCMMGTCFECLVAIDGHPNRQACQTIVHDGMVIARQHHPMGESAQPPRKKGRKTNRKKGRSANG